MSWWRQFFQKWPTLTLFWFFAFFTESGRQLVQNLPRSNEANFFLVQRVNHMGFCIMVLPKSLIQDWGCGRWGCFVATPFGPHMVLQELLPTLICKVWLPAWSRVSSTISLVFVSKQSNNKIEAQDLVVCAFKQRGMFVEGGDLYIQVLRARPWPRPCVSPEDLLLCPSLT